jgi:hypothetical protein
LSRLNGKGPADARAFAGIAYRITGDSDHFDAVYLRPLNGQKVNPPSPRDQRAIQYFAYPDWKFNRLREQYPDGDYEAGADIGSDEWITLKLDINDTRLTATVNGTETLALSEPRRHPSLGPSTCSSTSAANLSSPTSRSRHADRWEGLSGRRMLCRSLLMATISTSG